MAPGKQAFQTQLLLGRFGPTTGRYHAANQAPAKDAKLRRMLVRFR